MYLLYTVWWKCRWSGGIYRNCLLKADGLKSDSTQLFEVILNT